MDAVARGAGGGKVKGVMLGLDPSISGRKGP
jgi:hypothetical protein